MSEKILIIEDDDLLRSAIETFIGAWKYEMYSAANGTTGLKIAIEKKPDLILLDLHLPDVPGLEVLRTLREIDGLLEIPVFMMSADDNPEMHIIAMSSGGVEFLNKPLNFADLAMKIQQTFELQKYKRQINDLNSKLEKEKKRLSRYFADDLVEKLLNEEISTELGGAIVMASIMFFDIRGSTPLAEKIGPLDYAQLISGLFGDIMERIFRYGGSVNEMMGDGMLATFGCPVAKPEDAKNAVRTAMAIREHMNMFNRLRVADHEDPIGFGIGIATGKVFAGNIGSIRLMKYAVMGDPVNTAARIQDLTKEFPHQIIIDAETEKLAGDLFPYVAMAPQHLRGKIEPVKVAAIA